MKRDLAAFASGLLFAAGLLLSGMTQPSNVLAFLDVAGAWDPSLALVMGGAVTLSALAFWIAGRRASPLLTARFEMPPRLGPFTARMLIGAGIFGLGWGLSGLCPGPAVVSLAGGSAGAWIFVAAMLAGILLEDAVTRALGATPGLRCDDEPGAVRR